MLQTMALCDGSQGQTQGQRGGWVVGPILRYVTHCQAQHLLRTVGAQGFLTFFHDDSLFRSLPPFLVAFARARPE